MNTFVLLLLAVFSVVSVVNGDLEMEGDRDVNRLDDDKAEINARLRRAVWHGAFKSSSNKEAKYHKKIFSHKMSINPEGDVSTDTKHHHEKGAIAEQSNRAGVFKYHNNNGQGWDNSLHDF